MTNRMRMALTIYYTALGPSHIFYSILWERTWKRKFANSVPNGKRGLPLEVVHNFRKDFPENCLSIWPQTEISGLFAIWLNGKHPPPPFKTSQNILVTHSNRSECEGELGRTPNLPSGALLLSCIKPVLEIFCAAGSGQLKSITWINTY